MTDIYGNYTQLFTTWRRSKVTHPKICHRLITGRNVQYRWIAKTHRSKDTWQR